MNSIPGLKNRQKKKIRILIVDDSPVIRKIFTVMLGGEPDMEVVAAVPDPYVARDLIVREEPDVILLDIQMPRMDGLTFLRKLMKYFPVPVIIISSFTRNNSGLAMEAVETGAVDVLAKPDGSYTSSDLRLQLAHKIRAAARVDVKANLKRKTAPPSPSSMPESNDRLFRVAHKIIAIGASTGGTDALTQVITAIPVNSPGIVMVQHMPAGFTHSFAERLNSLSRVRVKEAEDGDLVRPGTALLAPGNYHMILRSHPGGYKVKITEGPMVCHQRPAVDVLFDSVARYAGGNAVGIILTGMGNDGARGIISMKKAGALTIAQDEKTSVVFGMPKEAIKTGCIDRVVPLRHVAGSIISMLLREKGPESRSVYAEHCRA